MPIKIKDPAVYECYDSAVCQTEAGNTSELFENFASQLNSSYEELSIDDILKVTDAIWNEDDLEFEEPKYALRLKGRTKFLYLTVSSHIGSQSLVLAARSFALVSTQQYMTADMWDGVFISMPWLDRDAFEKIYEDD
ncbi:hypothetical protein [Lentilactobacillus senioris]|uniref:hypothetical protein n=1 Tax=Lentilactobacillus senioris TaxID=931534 RepID=UPI003D2B954A